MPGSGLLNESEESDCSDGIPKSLKYSLISGSYLIQNSGKMFSDYKAAVVNSYQQKLKEGSLSLNLQQPSPAKLKKECLSVFGIRRTKNDLEILSQFFGHRSDEATYEAAIRTMDTDKFRPLVKLLIGKVKDTEDKNIALLSWLIDYYPRPYRFGYSHTKTGTESEGNKEHAMKLSAFSTKELDASPMEVEDIDQVSGMGTSHIPISQNKVNYFQKYKRQGLIGIGVLMASVVGISSGDSLKSSFSSMISTKPPCMYWSENEYVAVSCEQKVPNVQVIAADDFKLEHFKRITRPDTLTYQDVGKVWYASVNKQIEFYTSAGEDPRLPGRQLRPMSKYIFEKYILPLKAAQAN